MYPYDKNRPSYDPCELVKTRDGREKLRSLIEGTGYVVNERLFRAFVVCARLRKPMLLAGHRGGGKSEFPLAIYQGCNIPCFWQQCREGLTEEDLLYRWQVQLQNQFVSLSVGCGAKTFEEASEEMWSRKYLKLGKIAAALEFAHEQSKLPADKRVRAMYVGDEEDKLGPVVEDMTLEPLAFGRVTVEGYERGYVGFGPGSKREHFPLMFFTSNDLRNDASSPFRSRCYFFPINLADEATQIEIFRSRFPGASRELVRTVARLFDDLRLITGFRDKPNVREALDVMEACLVEGVDVIGEELMEDCLGLLAKRQSDYEVISKSHTVERLVDAVGRENGRVDELIGASYLARAAESVGEGATR